jgi:DNA ligase-1
MKEYLLERLMNSMSNLESDIFTRILFGEMRIGVSDGVMLDSIAEATNINLNILRRALMMTGDIGKVAKIAIIEGERSLNKIKVQLFMPLKPMLANSAENTSEAIDEHGGKTAFEYKYDGARIQIHRLGDQIKMFSRNLLDVTDSIPDIVKLINDKIPVGDLILEGEILAIGERGLPLPFQDLMRRFSRIQNVEGIMEKVPLKLYLFDLLFYDGNLLIDETYTDRWTILKEITPTEILAKRIITNSIVEAQTFFNEALNEGHEGLIAKRLESNYAPGSRGKKWLKIKQIHTIDVVILAADWGSGRRKRWLSNYHLGVWNGEKYLVIGKTFKGLTDEQFRWMTKYLQKIKVFETKYTINVKPELVVEVAFNEIQKSTKYESGLALRFARIIKIREDKSPGEAEKYEKVSELYEMTYKQKDKWLNRSFFVSRYLKLFALIGISNGTCSTILISYNLSCSILFGLLVRSLMLFTFNFFSIEAATS